MADIKTKVLLIVEGEKTDVKLMNHLFEIYNIKSTHKIVSYKTNIYTLYGEMFKNNDPDSLDIQNVLLEKAVTEEEKEILKDVYSDIIIIFDFDPQDSSFTPESIIEMMEYFTESTDMGKLYINYPMVEAFYHMKSIPDNDFYNRTVSKDVLISKKYKWLVNMENRNHDYNKFAVNADECSIIIKQNIEKAYYIINNKKPENISYNSIINKDLNILEKQLHFWDNNYVSVLCCCVFYICDFNVNLVYK